MRQFALAIAMSLTAMQWQAGAAEGIAAPREVHIVPTHPRFAFRKDELAKLRRRCLTTHSREYANLKSNGDFFAILGIRPTAPGLIYQLTGESRYLQFAGSDYDAFHEAMPPEQAGRMASDILYSCRRQISIDGNMGRPIKGGDGTGYTTHSLQVSNSRTEILPILGDDVPIALPGEMEKRAKWLAQRVDELRQIYNTIAYRRGGKATSFHCACFFGRVPNFFEHWRVATGEDYFGDPLLAGFILQPTHNTLPLDHSCAAMTNSWGHDHLGRPADYILASRAKDGLCQWVIHNPEWVTRRKVGKHDLADFDALGRAWLAAIDGLGGYKEHKWAGPVAWWTGHMPSRILYYEPSLEEVPPEKLPTSALFEGLGMVCMRSSWDDDAVFARLHSGPNFRGEPPHLNDNTFIIYHKGWLVKPERSTHKLTSYASSVLVKDPDEEIIMTGNYTGALDWNALWDGRLSDLRKSEVNDGGQSYWKPVVDRLNTKVRGKIDAYEAGDLFTYSVGDATQSYNPAKLKGFTRQFLYLKPGLVIIFDRVESTRPEFEKRWVLHIKGKPEETREPGVLVADAVSAAGWSARGYSRTPGFEVPKLDKGPPRTFTLEFETEWDGVEVGLNYKAGPEAGKLKWSLDNHRQSGELDQRADKEKTVLNAVLARRIPKGDHKIVLEETEGKINFSHFTVRMGGRLFVRTLLPEKFKREISPNVNAKDAPFDRRADWRVDVIPGEARTDDVFLSVLEATDIAQQKPLAVNLKKGNDKAVMTFRYDRRSYEVTFNRTGQIGGHLKIRLGRGRALVDKPLATGIVDGPDEHIERCRRLMRESPEFDYKVADIAHLSPEAEMDTLTAALADDRWHVRFYAIRGLAAKRDAAAAGKLAALLADSDERVAAAAAEALGRLGAKDAQATLIKSLASDKSELRLYAAWSLGEMKITGAVDPLIALLSDKNAFVSVASAEALGRIGDERAVPSLISAAAKANAVHMKTSYLWAMATIGGDAAEAELQKHRTSEEAKLRACAVAGLAALAGDEAAAILKAALRDENKHIRAFAERRLGELGNEATLQSHLADAKNEKLGFAARASSVGALGKLGYKAAADELAALLSDEKKQGKNDTLAAHAALALSKLDDDRGAEYLRAALMSGADRAKQHVAEGAAKALGSVEEKISVPILMHGLLLEKMNWQVKPAIVSSLYKATRQDPAGNIQDLGWNRFSHDAKCWVKWWEGNKVKYQAD